MADNAQNLDANSLVAQAIQAGKEKEAADAAAKAGTKALLAPGQWSEQVINIFGLDSSLPSGFVNVVYNADGNYAGYIKDGKVMPLLTPQVAQAPAKKPQIDQKKLNAAVTNEQMGSFQYAQHLEQIAAAEYDDLKTKANLVSRGNADQQTKADLAYAAKTYQSTVDAIKTAYEKSGVVQGAVKLDVTGKLAVGSTFINPTNPKSGSQTVTSQGTVPTSKVGTTPNAKGVVDPSKVGNVDPLLTNYTVYTAQDGSEYVVGTGSTTPQYLIPPTKAGEAATVVGDINTAKADMIKAAGGITKLDTALRAAGYSGTFDANLSSAINAYSTKALRDYQATSGKGNIGDVNGFISTLAASRSMYQGSGGGKSTISQNFMDRAGTDRYINKYFMDQVGTGANDAAKVDFYNQVHALESKTRTVTTNGTSVGSSLTNTDYDLVAANVSRNYLKGTSADALLKSSTPGQLATDVNRLIAFAGDYGVPMTTQQAMDSLAKGLGQSNYLAGQEDRIKQLAITLHPTLADHIKAGGTVKDLADTYANIYTRKLGVTVPDSTQNKDIMAAVTHPNGPINQNDFETSLQANPIWRTTPEAHNIASNFIDTIAKTWGLG